MAGAVCALALFLLVSPVAFADENDARFRPVTRGGRSEPAPAASVVAPAGTPSPSPTPAVTPAPTPSLSERIAGVAQQYVGSPYAFGGASPLTGFDCSGLVQWVLGQVGVGINSRSAAGQYAVGEPVAREQLTPGDLVFFANTYMPGISHVGVYVGDGQFVDAGTERTGVRRASLADSYWSARYVGARRIK
jgi:cell wall-associated NlpC family hydrolase